MSQSHPALSEAVVTEDQLLAFSPLYPRPWADAAGITRVVTVIVL